MFHLDQTFITFIKNIFVYATLMEGDIYVTFTDASSVLIVLVGFIVSI